MSISKCVGLGLRPPHYQYVLDNSSPIGWFEVHSENFFMQGGPALHLLDRICEKYPLSLHGVGLSLGSAERIDRDHLKQLKTLIERFSPFLVSEHLSWSRIKGQYLPDLLPIPYTDEALEIFSNHIDEAQSFLGREILIENPSSYLEYNMSTMTEPEFLNALCQKTGAKLLLDINNIYVSSVNHGWDPSFYLKSILPSLVGEIHLAGHSQKTFEDGSSLLIDTHSSQVCKEVWALYAEVLQLGMSAPMLIEWDTDIPDFEVLMGEARLAEDYLKEKKVVYG